MTDSGDAARERSPGTSLLDDILGGLPEGQLDALKILAAPHWLPASAVIQVFRKEVLPVLPELLDDDLVRVTASGSLAVPDVLRDKIVSDLTAPKEREEIARRLAVLFRGQSDTESQIESLYHELAFQPMEASRQMFRQVLIWRSEPFFAHHLVQRLVGVWSEFRARHGLAPAVEGYLQFAGLLAPGRRLNPQDEVAILQRIDPGEDELFEAYVGVKLGSANSLLGKFNEAREALERASRLFGSLKNGSGVATAQRLLGRVAMKVDRYADAKLHYQEALSLSRAAGRKVLAAECLQGIGEIHTFEGNYREAARSYEEAIDLLAGIGGRTAEANTRVTYGQLLVATGALPAASEHIRLAEKVYDALEQKIGRANCLLVGATIDMERGDLDGAAAKVEAAEALFRALRTPTGLIGCAEINGQIAQLRGSYEEAESQLTRAQEMAESIDDRFGAATCLRDRGVLAMEQGRGDEARERLARSAELFEAIGARTEAALATVLAHLAGAPVDSDQAEVTLMGAGAVLPRAYRNAWNKATEQGSARLLWTGGANNDPIDLTPGA